MQAGRFVVDTNTLVSRLLLSGSIPAQAVQKAIRSGDLLFSSATLTKLNEVLRRPKLDRYLEPNDREQFMRLLARLAIIVQVTHAVQCCRDPKDDKFLEVAINGLADVIISGDADLLELNPFRGIPILSPREFLGYEMNS
ncbi:MAG: putative toxin-antitoxin system toxin component, PIN family [Oceanipulchritudo sp.]